MHLQGEVVPLPRMVRCFSNPEELNHSVVAPHAVVVKGVLGEIGTQHRGHPVGTVRRIGTEHRSGGDHVHVERKGMRSQLVFLDGAPGIRSDSLSICDRGRHEDPPDGPQ